MVTITSILRLDATTYEINWSSDIVGARFYLYLDGALIAVTTQTSYVLEIESGGSAVIDILDTADPPKIFSRRFVLAWYGVAGAASYRVEEQVGSDWLVRATIADKGEGYFKFPSRVAEDAQTHNFRVTAIAASTNPGTVAALTALMVRIPDPPAVTMSYSALTGAATFAAA